MAAVHFLGLSDQRDVLKGLANTQVTTAIVLGQRFHLTAQPIYHGLLYITGLFSTPPTQRKPGKMNIEPLVELSKVNMNKHFTNDKS